MITCSGQEIKRSRVLNYSAVDSVSFYTVKSVESKQNLLFQHPRNVMSNPWGRELYTVSFTKYLIEAYLVLSRPTLVANNKKILRKKESAFYEPIESRPQ